MQDLETALRSVVLESVRAFKGADSQQQATKGSGTGNQGVSPCARMHVLVCVCARMHMCVHAHMRMCVHVLASTPWYVLPSFQKRCALPIDLPRLKHLLCARACPCRHL